MTGRVLMIVPWVLLGVPVVLLLALLGVPLPFGIAWILVFAAAVLIARLSYVDESEPWPPAPNRPPHRGSDVSRLAWTVDTRAGVVGGSFRRRIRALADRRLREHGVLPEHADAATVDAILGPGAHAALAAPPLRLGELERLLQALEQPPHPSNLERP